MSATELTIVLPVYNERDVIQRVVEDARSEARRQQWDCEIIVVDDGSHDGTADAIGGVDDPQQRVRVIRHKHNQGYGAALYTGFQHAQKKWVFFTDGDGQFRFNRLADFVALATDNTIVVGYRETRQDRWHRRLYARLWNRMVALLLKVQVRDINCAYKLIPKSCIERLDTPVTGPGFNADILAQFTALQLAIVELPVPHYPRQSGQATGGSLKTILRAVLELFQLVRKRQAQPV